MAWPNERIEWFQGKTLTHCANDLHGPYLGLDGWIYWCKGAFARQTYERPGKSPFQTRAAHIFRCRPDGTGIEPVMTGGNGQPGGCRIHPRRRTDLHHDVPGASRWGQSRRPDPRDLRRHLWQDPRSDLRARHKWTGPEVMPVLLHMGPAAPCGLTRYESDAFGKAYQDNLFACYFNLHKVGRHVLVPQGATFSTKDEDFVSSPDLDFHPTDVLEDADGSLLIVDTGGWYKLCCPTSQLHKPDVLGGIYRVRREGMPKLDDPWGKELWRREQTRDVNDVRWWQISSSCSATLGRPCSDGRSTLWLAPRARGPESSRPLRELAAEGCDRPPRGEMPSGPSPGSTIPSRRHWCREFLADPDETVRQAAIHVAGLWRDTKRRSRLIELLQAPSAQNRSRRCRGPGSDRREGGRAGAAGGRGSSRATAIIEHSITYALIEIDDPSGTAAGLRSKNAGVLRAAMVALDQMDGGELDPKFVAGLLASTDPILKETASWIVGRHPRVGRRAGRTSWASGWTGPTSRPPSGPSWSGNWAGSRTRRRSSSSWPRGCKMLPPRRPRGGAACRPWPGRA